jgi:hypothetical protein
MQKASLSSSLVWVVSGYARKGFFTVPKHDKHSTTFAITRVLSGIVDCILASGKEEGKLCGIHWKNVDPGAGWAKV